MNENTPTINDIVQKVPYIAERLTPEEVMRWIVIEVTQEYVHDWRDGPKNINWPALANSLAIHNSWLRKMNFLSQRTQRRMRTVLENMFAASKAAWN